MSMIGKINEKEDRKIEITEGGCCCRSGLRRKNLKKKPANATATAIPTYVDLPISCLCPSQSSFS